MTSPNSTAIPCLLSIAGSDSGGGAGIQADLKICSHFNVHCATAITSITAQNTQGVAHRHDLPSHVLLQQLDAISRDLNPKVIKIGMLGSADNVEAVASWLSNQSQLIVVADPVICSSSGHALLDDTGITHYIDHLLPQIDVITPNLAEASRLLNCEQAHDVDAMQTQARQILALGAHHVLLKGGHLGGQQLTDVLLGPNLKELFHHTKINSENTHATGCFLSTAVAVHLLLGDSLLDATQKAIAFVENAITHASEIKIGSGHSPLQVGEILDPRKIGQYQS